MDVDKKEIKTKTDNTDIQNPDKMKTCKLKKYRLDLHAYQNVCSFIYLFFFIVEYLFMYLYFFSYLSIFISLFVP